MARLVADGAGIHFRRTEAVEKTVWKVAGDGRIGTLIMRVQHSPRAVFRYGLVNSPSNHIQCLGPTNRCERAGSFSSYTPHWRNQSRRIIAPYTIIGGRAFC